MIAFLATLDLFVVYLILSENVRNYTLWMWGLMGCEAVSAI